MRLKDFYKDYAENRGPSDCLSVYFDRGRAEGLPPCICYVYEDEIRQAAETGGLLMEADIIKCAICEGQAVDAMTKGQGRTIKIWRAEIDANQARLARQERHPASSKPEPKTRKATKNRQRFTL